MILTVLVFIDINNPCKGTRVASMNEWNQILRQNQNLPREARRFFIEDRFFDFGQTDCMYIETTKEKYDEWHKEKSKYYREHVDQPQMSLISGDILSEADDATIFDTIAGNCDVEKEALDSVLICDLREALCKWKKWAPLFLDLYLANEKSNSVKTVRRKFDVPGRTARRWKRSFEEFVSKFLYKQGNQVSLR